MRSFNFSSSVPKPFHLVGLSGAIDEHIGGSIASEVCEFGIVIIRRAFIHDAPRGVDQPHAGIGPRMHLLHRLPLFVFSDDTACFVRRWRGAIQVKIVVELK